jgi:hypothetical protein
MFYHEDLEFYKNKNFRSFEYINFIWNLIESDFIYSLGLIYTGNITIVIDSDLCYLTVTSNFNHIFENKYNFNFQHSLGFCEDFSIEIDICLINSSEFFIIEKERCQLYFQKNKFDDEGIIEYYSHTNLNVSNYKEFKERLFLSLVREIQFSINKNIFNLDICNYDSTKSEIDSDYEVLRTYSIIKDKSIDQSIIDLNRRKIICIDNILFLRNLVNRINQ